jgi:site-specific recombinase
MSLEMVVNATLGVVLIGAVNLLVSFNLALWVALRARNIRFTRSVMLLRALVRRFMYAPLDFFIGPRDVEVIDIPVFTREHK